MSPAPAAADIAGSLLGGATGLYRAIVEACEDGIIAGTGFVDPSGSLGPNGSWRLLVAEGDAVSAGQPLIELIGEAVRRLRTEVTGLHQSQFAKMCKISVRTLVHIEHGEGNQTLKSLNAVFRPFGMQMGVVKLRRHYS